MDWSLRSPADNTLSPQAHRKQALGPPLTVKTGTTRAGLSFAAAAAAANTARESWTRTSEGDFKFLSERNSAFQN